MKYSKECLKELIGAYYIDEPVGDNLHVVLDEGGTSDELLHMCYFNCLVDGDVIGETICKILLAMHPATRKYIVNNFQPNDSRDLNFFSIDFRNDGY